MKKSRNFTAIIKREDDMYVSFCPEVNVASQGKTIEEARNNLKEALELFFELASDERKRRDYMMKFWLPGWRYQFKFVH